MNEENLSKYNRTLLEAYRKGYRVVDGEVISPFRDEPLKQRINRRGYYEFGVRVKDERFNLVWETRKVQVHRLAAYQKFGEAIFQDGVQVRHLDDNSKNNLEDNIGIGTQQDNMMDRSPEKRLKLSVNAATKLRKFDDETVAEIRLRHSQGWSYRTLMAHYNITSKGTMSHIINNKYKTKV